MAAKGTAHVTAPDGKHALCAPSGADRWMTCEGSVAMEMIEPPSDSEYSREGTRAHWLATVYFGVRDGAAATPTITDDYPEDMHEYVQGYVDDVLARVELYKTLGYESVTLHIEQKLPLEPVTGEVGNTGESETGTGDAIIIATRLGRDGLVEGEHETIIDVNDLKYGMGVRVAAERNAQLRIYALAAIFKFGVSLNDSTKVLLRIHQPRVFDAPSEWDDPIDELIAFAALAREKATLALSLIKVRPSAVHANLHASEDACRFCRAAARCPELTNVVHKTVFGDFQAIDDPAAQPILPADTVESQADYLKLLPLLQDRTEMVENWVKAVRAKTEQVLLAGEPLDRWKLVMGRMGRRKYSDPTKVEEALRVFDLETEDIYEPAPIKSPAVLEKTLGKKKGPPHKYAAWKAIQIYIKQDEGKPSVARADDPRPLYEPRTESDFEDVSKPIDVMDVC